MRIYRVKFKTEDRFHSLGIFNNYDQALAFVKKRIKDESIKIDTKKSPRKMRVGVWVYSTHPQIEKLAFDKNVGIFFFITREEKDEHI